MPECSAEETLQSRGAQNGSPLLTCQSHDAPLAPGLISVHFPCLSTALALPDLPRSVGSGDGPLTISA